MVRSLAGRANILRDSPLTLNVQMYSIATFLVLLQRAEKESRKILRDIHVIRDTAHQNTRKSITERDELSVRY